MTTYRHYQSQPIAAAGEVPEWVLLIPAGTFMGADGRGPFYVRDASALITASMADGKIPLDENHATDFAAPIGAPSPAVGWIVEMQSRADGIWGRVDWNESGRQLMADRAYRGISPVFDAAKKDGEIKQVLRAALTNTPNLNLRSLHSQENRVDLTKFRAALGLPETAGEAEVLSAIATLNATITAHSASIAAIAAAAGAKATDAAGLVTELQTVRATGGDIQAMTQKIVGLETELNTLKAAGARKDAEAFIDGAIREGKPIASLRDHYIARHMANRADVEREIGALVSIHAGGTVFPPKTHSDSGDDEAMSAEEMAICKKMGQDPKAFVKHRNEMRKKKAA